MSGESQPIPAVSHRWRRIATVAAFGAAGGCHAQGATPLMHDPLPAEVRRLQPRTLAHTDEYLASVTSRRSIGLYPRVSGYVTRIRVRPGDRVKAGAELVDIDSRQQQAMLRSLQADLLTKTANLGFAAQNDESSRRLLEAGLLGRLDYEQRHSQHLSATADVAAARAQVQSQADLLRFYRVTAPTAGVMGDVPVKIGDYVTPQTPVTSVNQADVLEVYVYVPPAKANLVGPATTLELMGDDGQTLCTEHPSFVSPVVSVATQMVLIKASCPNQGPLRSAQVLRARLAWSTYSGVTIPISAVTRQSGQHFAFVAESGAHGTLARQRPIGVGPIVGNDYVVTSGLAPGSEVVVSNIQKMRDGMPIQPLGGRDAPGPR